MAQNLLALSNSFVADFRGTAATSMTPQSIELEEGLLGAILLDPSLIAAVSDLVLGVFEISAHRTIFQQMLELHQQGLQPDLHTVAVRMADAKTLQPVGGQAKLAQLLDRTIHSGNLIQYAKLLQERYFRRYLTDNFSRMAEATQNGEDFDVALQYAQQYLDTVTGDTSFVGDTPNLDTVGISKTVTSVTKILNLGLPEWKEQIHLDAIEQRAGLSRAAFAQMLASLKCQCDEVTVEDKERLNQLIDWSDSKLDFKSVLPLELAADLIHDADILNIDPIMLWQYLMPATLSLVGKKNDLDVRSHRVPAIAWTCIVAESGTGKTRAESLILAPLKEWQLKESKRYQEDLKEYKARVGRTEDSARPHSKACAKNNNDEEKPQPPSSERKYLFEIATIQAVVKRLGEQTSNGTVWARDEISGLFKSLGQFTKSEGEGVECLLRLWDGAGTQVDRVSQEDSFIMAMTRLCIAGSTQPGVYRKCFKDPDDANGLQARFLFAVAKIRPIRRVKGYCHLSDKLPNFYNWVDQEYPAGTLRLSRSADKSYDYVTQQIGLQAEKNTNPAIRAWMRKLPTQLLRIALALHVIECYYQPSRPRHEVQVDTIQRATEIARYYRSAFHTIQELTADSDDTSSVLIKIWDMATTFPEGVAVRDAYRNIKALQRRAKELGRTVSAYTQELYYQLERMGKGVVERCGRVVRFVVGNMKQVANDQTIKQEPVVPEPVVPEPVVPEPVTVVTVTEKHTQQDVQLSSIKIVSPVTLEQIMLFGGKCLAEWKKNLAGCLTLDDAIDFYHQLELLCQPERQQLEACIPADSWSALFSLPEV